MAVQTTLGSCLQCTAAPDQAQITIGNAERPEAETVACPRFHTVGRRAGSWAAPDPEIKAAPRPAPVDRDSAAPIAPAAA